jgi:hypothetical protein
MNHTYVIADYFSVTDEIDPQHSRGRVGTIVRRCTRTKKIGHSRHSRSKRSK